MEVLKCAGCVTLKLFLKELNNVNFVKKMCVMQLVNVLKTPAEPV
jgi:hypothetical protein